MNRSAHGVGVWILQVLANAALLAFVWWWLTWPDAHVWQVAASFIAAAAVLFMALCVHCATLGYFATQPGSLAAAFRRCLARIPAFLLWVVLTVAVLWALQWLKASIPQASVRGAQLGSTNPRQAMRAAAWILFLVQWVVVPVLLLPLASEISAEGFRGWSMAALRRLRRLTYWLGAIAALVLGIYVPYKLLLWVPQPSSLRREAWSIGIRFTAAYLLMVTAWVLFAALLGRDARQTDSTAAEHS
jgi:hypothetical protein